MIGLKTEDILKKEEKKKNQKCHNHHEKNNRYWEYLIVGFLEN